jgi:hypothetical protein
VSRGEIAGISHWTPARRSSGHGRERLPGRRCGWGGMGLSIAAWWWRLRVVRGRRIGDGHCGGYDASDYAAAAPGGSMSLRQDYASVIHRALPPVVEIKQRPGLARADWSRVGGFLN